VIKKSENESESDGTKATEGSMEKVSLTTLAVAVAVTATYLTPARGICVSGSSTPLSIRRFVGVCSMGQ